MMHEHDPVATALEVSRATGWNLEAWRAEREWSAVGVGPCGRSRDSDALERSNMTSALETLTAAGARFDIVRFGHWAVGWVEEIAHDAGDAATVDAVASIRAQLDRYPVLDDEAYSDLEWADNHPDGARLGAYCYAERDEECHQVDSLGRIVRRRDERGRFARW